jgi:hydrogenase maturation protein HypF
MERATVQVNGIVQSVGFRPFVYRTSVDLDLHGTVRNRGDAGVRIELEGASENVDVFLKRLREDNPPLARVETVETERKTINNHAFESFEIVKSESGESGGGTIPSDTAMCDACVADMRDPDSRYHEYWATSCLDCGPRFTVVESLPYDRPTTSMAAFPLCDDCRKEYEEPTDRRYHAQAIACPQCGPTLRYGVVEKSSEEDDRSQEGRDPFPNVLSSRADGRDAIGEAVTAIDDGEIVVVKGIGGAHLICDATDQEAVVRLRKRTGRPEKPFAVMGPDIDTVESFAHLTDAERESLTSPQRPILLLDECDDHTLSSAVSPGLHTVGVMLPYSGAHHLLFDDRDGPLVMTSANMPGQPMLVANSAITAGLNDVADGFLLHDRRIIARCDDSVARFVDGERRLVRRSRGFAPTSVPIPGTDRRILGLGPELDVTAGILADGDCYLTQYVGDVDTVESFEYLTDSIEHLLSITGIDHPPIVAHDLHPEFHTTEHARHLEHEQGIERVPVQHHHAHAASVLAEHKRDAAIAITVDGVGYGPDGTVWGGEVLDATCASYERVAGLAPMAMPGGDRATLYPGRMLAGALFPRLDAEGVHDLLEHHGISLPGGDEERDLVCQQLAAGVNTAETTSAGRFLDAVSALLGVCNERTYEGEPAMKLEALATRGDAQTINRPFGTADGRQVLDTPALLDHLVTLVENGVTRPDVAATAQDALARGIADLAIEAAADKDRDAVVLSGGVAYNEHITSRIRERVEDAQLTFLGNERVPSGDGGIAYGQIAVAATRAEDH